MSEVKSLKPGQRVKILSAPSEAPHKLNHHIGTVAGNGRTVRNAAGQITYKSYNVQIGNASVVEVEARYLYSVGGE